MENNEKIIFKNTFFNIIRTLSSILFPLITYPYIARILRIEDLGKIEFSKSIISYVILFSSVGIPTYAIREGAKIRDDKKEFSNFVNQIFTINIFTTVVSILLLFLLTLSIDYLEEYRQIVFIFVFIVIGTTLAVDWLNSIFEDFKYLTIRNIIIQFISLILIIVFVKRENDYLIYAWILVFSSVGMAIFNYFYCRKYVNLKLTLKINWSRHTKPILYIFAINIATVIYVNLDMTMINIYLGDLATGLYSAALKIYSPLKSVVSAIIVVSLPRISNIAGISDQMTLKQSIYKIYKFLITTVVLISMLVYFQSDNMIIFLAGDQYEATGLTLKILSISVIMSALASFMTTSVLLPFGHESKILQASIVSAIANFVLNLYFIPNFGIYGAAVTTLIAEFLMFIISCINGRKYIMLNKMLNYFFICIIFSLPIYFVKQLVDAYIDSIFFNILTVSSVSILIYSLLILMSFKLNKIKLS